LAVRVRDDFVLRRRLRTSFEQLDHPVGSKN
jgi:hypothetical protein